MKYLLHTDGSCPGIGKILQNEGHQVFTSTLNIFLGLQYKPDAIIIDHIPNNIIKFAIDKSKIPVYYLNDSDQFLLSLDSNSNKNLLQAYQLRTIKATTKKLFDITLSTIFSKGIPCISYVLYITQVKFLAGDLGETNNKFPQSLLMVALQYNPDSKLVNRIFTKPILEFLKNIEYSGPLGIQCSISADDHYPYFNKFIVGFNTSFYTLNKLLSPHSKVSALFQKPDFLNEYANVVDLNQLYSLTVCVSLPHYPYSLNPNGYKFEYKEDPDYYCFYSHSSVHSYITSSADTWQQARLNVGKIINKLKENSDVLQFRIDAGMQGQFMDHLFEMYPDL